MTPSPRLSSLSEIERAIWQALTQATRERDHAWRNAVLATVDGDAADARSVVLREVDADAHRLVVYTDSRAGKVAQLRTHPSATLLMWSPQLSWQLRCRVHCEVEDEGLAVSSRWALVRLSPTAQDYLSPLSPGTALGAQPAALSHRENFAVVTASVISIDWLELHRNGHRRAQFADGAARWLQP